MPLTRNLPMTIFTDPILNAPHPDCKCCGGTGWFFTNGNGDEDECECAENGDPMDEAPGCFGHP